MTAMPTRIHHSASAVDAGDLSYLSSLSEKNFVGFGAECQCLIDELRATTGRKHVTLTGSGTAALWIALLALHRQSPGRNQVVTHGYVCPAVVNAILGAGLQPVFADCEPTSLSMSRSVSDQCNDRTLAIVITNLAGVPDSLSTPPGIPVICDCAQSLGTTVMSGRPMTAFGMVAVLSFAPTKIITGGLGGALVCDDDALAQIISELATTELSPAVYQQRGFVPTLGQYFSDVNAGLVRSQLAKLHAFIARRREISEIYDNTLRQYNQPICEEPDGVRFNRYRYYFFNSNSREIIEDLQSKDIDARGSLSHRSASYFPSLGEPANIAQLAPQVVSLPIHCAMSTEDASRVATALRSYFDRKAG